MARPTSFVASQHVVARSIFADARATVLRRPRTGLRTAAEASRLAAKSKLLDVSYRIKKSTSPPAPRKAERLREGVVVDAAARLPLPRSAPSWASPRRLAATNELDNVARSLTAAKQCSGPGKRPRTTARETLPRAAAWAVAEPLGGKVDVQAGCASIYIMPTDLTPRTVRNRRCTILPHADRKLGCGAACCRRGEPIGCNTDP